MTRLLLLVLLSTQVLANPPTCVDVLSQCKVIVDMDTQQIGHLERNIKLLEDKVVEEEKTPLLPWWAVAGVAGLVGGIILGSKLK